MPLYKKSTVRKTRAIPSNAVSLLPPSLLDGDSASAATSILLSPQQSAVVDWVESGEGNVFVEALAGTGKTHTLIAASRNLHGSASFAAFNKKIADEIKYKVRGSNMRVGTFHSFGYRAWRNHESNAQVDADLKRRNMMDALEIPWDMRSAVAEMVSLAKQSVVGRVWDTTDIGVWDHIIDHFDILLKLKNFNIFDDDTEIRRDLIYYAAKGVQWSAEQGKYLIDFDDMLWLPLLEDVGMYQNDWILVDEANDTNAARRMLAHKMVKECGRSIFVGDRNQSIYGFTGADSDAIDLIIKEFNCTTLPLTVTFRCSKAATELAQKYVPAITAAESNQDGSVTQCNKEEFYRTYVSSSSETGLKPGDAILCRNTKPLITLALQLIREGIGCHVEGRDIGKQIDRLVSRWNVSEIGELVKNLEMYKQKEIEKLIARDAGYLIERVNDRVETVYAVMEGCKDVAAVRDRIRGLFEDSEVGKENRTVTLSTIHKFKGREADRVFILGFYEYMPSKYARQEWQKRQERNLIYVGITRSKKDLILLSAVE
jgi:superfamily I DNA/RNA helicase